VYVAFILLLPIETSTLVLMALGFIIGFVIDIFTTALVARLTMVFIAYLRNYWLGAITPQGGYDLGTIPNLNSNDSNGF